MKSLVQFINEAKSTYNKWLTALKSGEQYAGLTGKTYELYCGKYGLVRLDKNWLDDTVKDAVTGKNLRGDCWSIFVQAGKGKDREVLSSSMESFTKNMKKGAEFGKNLLDEYWKKQP